MKLAVMQPYLFPYIGYFQLLNAVDKFVIYDDVTFIKQGWINRNNILLNGKAHLFTIPLKGISSHKLIRETEINDSSNWKLKLMKTFEQAYKKAPFYNRVLQLIEEVVFSGEKQIAAMGRKSLQTICSYLEIDTFIVETSAKYFNDHLHAQTRVIDICRRENAAHYLNAIGGSELYSKEEFDRENIKLNFIKPKRISYKQFNNEFVPSLSIIDTMMFNSPTEIREMLEQYELI
jgi:hypothetical protein